MFDIIVIGSATVDVFAKTDAELISISGKSHGEDVNEKLIAYPLGTKILMKELDFKTGGGGTNVCATFVKHKLKTAYIGKIGKDVHGHQVFEWLKNNNITFLGQLGGQTGYSVILDSQADDRTILTFKGANNDLDFSKLPKHEMNAKWFYACTMLEKSFESMKKLFIFAKNNGIKTAFNPSNYLADKGLGYLGEIIKNTNLLILNKEEAELLVGKGEIPELIERLHNEGPSTVSISDGAKGAYVSDGKEKVHVAPAKNLKIVETTGAGDSFGAGLVSGLIQKKSLKESVLMGVINAEGVIQAYGAKEYIATKEEMNKLLKKKDHEISSF